MKIAIMNFSGNVGKTTVATNLLMPRMKGCKLFSIETINQGAEGKEVEVMKGKNFGDLIRDMYLYDSCIVDVGSSNVEMFMQLMTQYDGSQEDFDLFIIPTVKEDKVKADTINTIAALNELGVSDDRIRLLFNKVDADDDVDQIFAALYGYHKQGGQFTLNENCVIYNNEIFDRLKRINKTLVDFKNDKTDYKAKIKEVDKKEDKQMYAELIGLRRLSSTVNKNLDQVYSELL